MRAFLEGGALPAAVWLPGTVTEILTRAADLDSGAVVFSGSTLSYRALHAEAARIGRGLMRGTPTLLPCADPETFLPALWACFLAGAVPVLGPRQHTLDRLPPIANDVALLVCTSGSTGTPKTIALTHANVAASVAASAHVNGYTPDDVSLNWLPLWHVGGLMRSIREVYIGCAQVQIATAWVRDDPLRWLDLVDAHRATLTWGPNAAFAAVVAQRC
jgi:acyl-CoA synthetase (AMP-forming)/AMP-acid ligase II